MSVERLAALAQLLAQPDPRWLKGRGHVVVQSGKRDRWTKTWLPAAHVWTTQRLTAATDPEDGWTPARRDRLPVFLQPLARTAHLELVVRDLSQRHRWSWH